MKDLKENSNGQGESKYSCSEQSNLWEKLQYQTLKKNISERDRNFINKTIKYRDEDYYGAVQLTNKQYEKGLEIYNKYKSEK